MLNKRVNTPHTHTDAAAVHAKDYGQLCILEACAILGMFCFLDTHCRKGYTTKLKF